jgi:Uma2 family endonuclease
MVATRLYTVQDLERMTSDEAERYELYAGVLREVEAMGGWHGEIGVELIGPLYLYLRTNPIGRVYTDSTHFVLMRDPDVVLMPDVSFVSADRLPPYEAREGVMHLAPDLAVEILSPSNRAREMAEKVALYQQAGVRLIWVVQPRRRAVTVHTLGGEPRTLHETDELDGGDVLPGFRLPVADLFR